MSPKCVFEESVGVSVGRKPALEAHLQILASPWFGESHFTSWSLRFLLCKRRVINNIYLVALLWHPAHKVLSTIGTRMLCIPFFVLLKKIMVKYTKPKKVTVKCTVQRHLSTFAMMHSHQHGLIPERFHRAKLKLRTHDTVAHSTVLPQPSSGDLLCFCLSGFACSVIYSEVFRLLKSLTFVDRSIFSLWNVL